MKHLLILVVLSSLILAGCSQQNESIQTDMFTKKQECANYTNELQRDMTDN